MDKQISDAIDALVLEVEKDAYCQECALQHVSPALIRLLKATGKPIPAWLQQSAEFMTPHDVSDV